MPFQYEVTLEGSRAPMLVGQASKVVTQRAARSKATRRLAADWNQQVTAGTTPPPANPDTRLALAAGKPAWILLNHKHGARLKVVAAKTRPRYHPDAEDPQTDHPALRAVLSWRRSAKGAVD